MWKGSAILGPVLIVAGIIFVMISGPAAFFSEISGSTFHSHGNGEYISDEINIWSTSIGSISWDFAANNTHCFLVRAAALNSVNQSNTGRYAVPPNGFLLDNSTYTYTGLRGSYYVVAFTGHNSISAIWFIFTNSADANYHTVLTPSQMTSAQEVFLASISTIVIGGAIIAIPPFYAGLKEAGKNGLTPSLYIRQRLRKAVARVRALKRRARTGIVIAVVLLIAVAFAFSSYETAPRVISGYSLSASEFAFIKNTSASYKIINMSYLGLGSSYLVAMNGPVPATGGVNPGLLYDYFYTMEFVKISRNFAGTYIAQTPVVDAATLQIGNLTVPVNVSRFTVFASDWGFPIPIEIGLNGAGLPPPNALIVALTSELSVKIPDGNYTMYARVTFSPVNVVGPFHLKGPSQSIVLSIPVRINNQVQPYATL